MRDELRGKITDAQRAALPPCAAMHRLALDRHRLRDRELGTGALERGVGAVRQQPKRRDDRGPTRDATWKLVSIAGGALPIADGQRAVGRAREGVRIVRIARQHLLIAGDCLLVAAQPIEHSAAAVERLR